MSQCCGWRPTSSDETCKTFPTSSFPEEKSMDASPQEVVRGMSRRAQVRIALAMSAPTLSLVLPAYNEEDTIQQAIHEAVAALRPITSAYEVIVVEDGCTDRTAEIVRAEAAKNRSVRLV